LTHLLDISVPVSLFDGSLAKSLQGTELAAAIELLR